MDNIILYLLTIIQEQCKTICWLLNLICRYIPLRQWAFDDSHSPKYQKFTTDRLPLIKPFLKQDWQFLLEYYLWKYGKPVKPVQRRNGKSIPEDVFCPLCGAPHHYLYDNNGGNGQYQCKICGQTFVTGDVVTSPLRFVCPYCGHSLAPKKDRKFFRIHKCVNPRCSFYLHNLSKVDKNLLEEDYDKNKYKLHYLYREFTVDFFRMDLDSLPKNSSSLKFSKHNAHIMSLCLTMHVNLQLSLRKTAQALYDLYGIRISHQQVANYARTAAIVIKPFVDHYEYPKSSIFTADETYIKVRGIKGYLWFIMDAASRSILGY
ncbi:transposase, partial [Eisenbergiella tayi]|uniref:transposase n=1 Tax=Eisenbergiella tayi TaxID=1432052 RepID=UPI0009BD1B25